MNLSRGSWTIARFGGAPVRLHWSLPLGAFVMSGFRFAPAYWLGFVLLVLVHEVGHASIVLWHRLRVVEIMVHGVGGYCSHAPARTPFQESAIAWGGVLAQLAAFAVAQLWLVLSGPPASRFGAELAYVFTQTNLFLIALNLLPVEPLDGRKAWPLIGMLWRRFRGDAARGKLGQRRTVAEELRSVEKIPTRSAEETPSQRTDRLVRELISRTTQSK